MDNHYYFQISDKDGFLLKTQSIEFALHSAKVKNNKNALNKILILCKGNELYLYEISINELVAAYHKLHNSDSDMIFVKEYFDNLKKGNDIINATQPLGRKEILLLSLNYCDKLGYDYENIDGVDNNFLLLNGKRIINFRNLSDRKTTVLLMRKMNFGYGS